MRRIIASLIIALSIGFAGSTMAREIEDGNLLIYPTKDGKYKVGDFQGDKVSFYGYVGDKWETAKDKGKPLTGLLLKKGENATADQKHIVYVTAKKLVIGAFIEVDGKIQPIVEAEPAPAPAAQPAATPAPAPAQQ